MSHTVKIEVQFKTSELKQLETAFSHFGWGMTHNTTAREYAGSSKTYDHVAVNPGKEYNSFDIGIKANGDKLELFSDFYGGSIEASLGPDLRKLKQEFAAAVIENEYPNANITRSVDQAGNLLVEVEQW